MWRLATEAEDQKILSLGLELYREDPAERPISELSFLNTLQELRRSPARGRCVVFNRQDQIVGYALLISFWSNELCGEICTIDELYIRPEHRGQGLGTLLVHEVIERRSLWPNRPVALELEVTPSNARARALYTRLGFAPRKNETLRRRIESAAG